MGFVYRHPTIVLGGIAAALMILIAIFAPFLSPWIRPRWRRRNARARPRRCIGSAPTCWAATSIRACCTVARVADRSASRSPLLASIIGTFIGLIAGFTRWLDTIVMRVMDGLMSIPPILLAIALMALTRASMKNVIIAISVAEFPRVCRLVRGVVLSLREQPYVEAAIASGTRIPVIIWKHILPNTLAPLMVQATFICASAMITEATLSFLGAGTPPIIPSWGNIMAEGRALWQVKPYIVFFPAIFLCLTVLAVNMLGDGLRDALDPRLAKRL